jgi:hypothetical protein
MYSSFELKSTRECKKKEEGSSATDYVTDVTDVKDRRKKEEGRRKKIKEEGIRNKEEVRKSMVSEFFRHLKSQISNCLS